MGAHPNRSAVASAFVRELVLEHCEEAAHLWLLRGRAARSPLYDLAGLLELDNRLEAHVDALRLEAPASGGLCRKTLEEGRAEECFPAAVLAFETADQDLISSTVEKASAEPGASGAVVGALGWLPSERSRPHIQRLLASGHPLERLIGIAASTLQRRDPGHFLDDALYDGDARLRACALRAVGELGGRADRMLPARLRDHFTDADDRCRFWAARSAALLGDADAAGILKAFVKPDSPFQEEALQMAMRLMDAPAARAWQAELAAAPATRRLAVIGAGIAGDPALVPWLIGRMGDPSLARAAGEAVSAITGVDIAREGLEGKKPEGFKTGPSDDPMDGDVALDPDDGLPWPDADKMAVWWEKRQGQFPPGLRHLAGRPLSAGCLTHVLRAGRQPQRAAAALELAILKPGRPLFDVCAPAFRQVCP
ncbi:MAG: TIGR02270 family protein [Syntrophaceae bacterium]|nr:TIGR02270 family protein [Syntrophaceae bacterium]